MDAPTEAIPKHHQRAEICYTRPPYREGRIPKAVKVYTINQESKYLLVQGVPTVGASQELVKLFALYGAIDEYRILDEYPCDDFTEVYLICFSKIQSARFAKKKLDEYSFFGGVLHVCYAPEYETIEECRQKLQDRRKIIAAKTRTNAPTDFTLSLDDETKTKNSDFFQAQSNRVNSSSHTVSETSHVSNYLPAKNSDNNHQPHSALTHQFHPPDGQNVEHQREDISIQFDFRIPPPPVPGRNPSYFKDQKSRFEFAHVPSAHSTLPANFDGRLPISSTSKGGNNKISQQNTNKLINGSSGQILSEDSHKTEKNPAGNAGNQTNIIVREFKKKGPVPRFVPRQAVIKKDKDTTPREPPDKHLLEDDVSKQIKKNAFMLGKPEGPTLPNREVLNAPLNIPTEREQSVNQTVLDIRKRISKFIVENTSDMKKKKTS